MTSNLNRAQEIAANRPRILFVLGPNDIERRALRTYVVNQDGCYYLAAEELLETLNVASANDIEDDDFVRVVTDKICTEFLKGNRLIVVDGFPTSKKMAETFEQSFKRPYAALLVGVGERWAYQPVDPAKKEVYEKYKADHLVRRPKGPYTVNVKDPFDTVKNEPEHEG